MQFKGILEPGYQEKIPTVSRSEFQSLAHRVAELERAVKLLSSPRFTDQIKTPYAWGDQASEPYYHHGDIAGSLHGFASLISTTTRFTERLTSSEYSWVILKDSIMLGTCFTGIGAGAALFFHLPLMATSITGGISGFILSYAVQILLNRWDIHTLARGQADRDKKKRSELRVQIDKPGTHGMEFLYLNSHISRNQLREFARAALNGSSLGVHKWTGQGALFTRGQFDDLMSELETMGYILPARGNVSRSLNAKGRALMRGLAEDA